MHWHIALPQRRIPYNSQRAVVKLHQLVCKYSVTVWGFITAIQHPPCSEIMIRHLAVMDGLPNVIPFSIQREKEEGACIKSLMMNPSRVQCPQGTLSHGREQGNVLELLWWTQELGYKWENNNNYYYNGGYWIVICDRKCSAYKYLKEHAATSKTKNNMSL